MKNLTFNIKDMISRNLLLAVAALFVLAVSCDDFGDMNVDPNNPSVAKTDLLLTNALRSTSDVVGATTGVLYVQYFSETQYDDAARYSNPSFDFNGWYTGPLQDLNTIIALNENSETAEAVQAAGSNANQIAVARIMKAYYYHMMADRWGVIPYTEALKDKDNFRPAYDTQEVIYKDLIKELKEAAVQINTDELSVVGDIFFGGDMSQWQAFANSLRMRLALRIADKDNSLAETEFKSAMNGGLIGSTVFYPYLAEAANQNPWYARFITRTDYGLSDTMADTMIALLDQRVLSFGDPAPDKDNGDGVVDFNEIVGMPYSVANPGDIPNAAISFPSLVVRSQDSPLPIITLAELHFAMAEGIARGWAGISGTAQSNYEEGIKDSWNQWGYTNGDDQATYISKVAYDATNWKSSIGFQKWIALFPNGYEAWAEWRRLDAPALTPHAFALNDNLKIPTSHGYPTSEVQLNEENYNAGKATRGGDGLGVKLWWDAN